ncbi:hypothetical protein CYY_006650 [Polysphondylium violaceum]|uniref:Translation elongation factor KOW-like domain-containing protein n=1 Tax=Polysphondylium violaceum TaxID=133409 RepID=A0A8J4PQP3_9MYCE|nr:hypothetical protein CYY_006650 [Polysphondylium violaceum]
MNVFRIGQLTNKLSKFTTSTLNNTNNLYGLQYSKRFFDSYEIEAGDLKKGVRIEYKNKLLETLKVEHQKVAMRGGFIIAEFRNVLDGSKSSIKFRSAEALEAIDLNKKTYVLVPNQEGKILFRDVETDPEAEEDDIEYVECENVEQLGTYIHYLKYLPEDSEFSFREYNGNILEITGPKEITLPITKVSDNGNYGTMFFENGRTTKAPNHLKVGDMANIRLPDEVYLGSTKSKNF